MKRMALGAALASAAFMAVTPAAIQAQGDVALSRAAVELGFNYSYLGTEDVVELTKPGVTIVVRPGERLFDVNDRTEAMEGPAPRFYEHDVFISPQLFARLRAISAHYPTAKVGANDVTPHTVVAAATYVTGKISELDVRQVPGKLQVDVAGKAPSSNLPITLTLIGTFSSLIPDTVLTRRQVYTDDDGHFRTTVSIAPGYMQGAYLTLVASSVPGVASASFRFEVKAPNGDVSVPADQPPKSLQ